MALDNALAVQFESAYGMVELSPEIVTKYFWCAALKRAITSSAVTPS